MNGMSDIVTADSTDSAAAVAPVDAPFSLRDWLDGSLFLDFDGTLVELADTPEAVVVAPGLVDVLGLLQEKFGGRLAIVTGRPIEQIDAMLAPLTLPVAGVHGAERRGADGALHYAPAPAPSLLTMQLRAQQLVNAHPGLRLEEKRGALAHRDPHAGRAAEHTPAGRPAPGVPHQLGGAQG